jgi:ribosomal protein S8
MVIKEVRGKKKMKHFIIMVNQLQKSISRTNLTCIVPNTKYNQQILNLLQINGFINGFKILANNQQIIVYFKFVNNANVIKRIFRFKRFDKTQKFIKKKFGIILLVLLILRSYRDVKVYLQTKNVF